MPEGVETNVQSRRWWITKQVVRQYRPSPGCKGCFHAMTNNKGAVNHDEQCRERMLELMIQAGDPKVLEEAEKVIEESDRLRAQEEARREAA